MNIRHALSRRNKKTDAREQSENSGMPRPMKNDHEPNVHVTVEDRNE